MAGDPRHDFAARTYRHTDFDAAELADRKRAAGLRVVAILPARDEEATVGHVVATLRRELLERLGLLDEIVVVDADSRDATGRLAKEAGARVVRQSEVLPEAGTGPGKGEALWKGLAASDSDLVVFIDADLHDTDERFVVGLLGPLLHDPTVRFTKATYDRPLLVGDDLHATGGGRVTELLARPLIATFWPELGWLTQPLSGEYAGRRELFESLPFVRGYGVELAMLVDVLERHGAGCIAQVDLGRRIHEHQPLAALGRMSAELLHVALDRLARADRLHLADEPGAVLLQPLRDDAGRLHLGEHHIAVEERPPLATFRRGATDGHGRRAERR